jgi:hypothetical protein
VKLRGRLECLALEILMQEVPGCGGDLFSQPFEVSDAEVAQKTSVGSTVEVVVKAHFFSLVVSTACPLCPFGDLHLGLTLTLGVVTGH